MNIQITPEYRISSDVYQWKVEKHAPTKQDGNNYKSISYHNTVQGAVNSLGQRMIRTSEAQTLADALKDVENVTETLTHAFTQIPDIN